MPASRWGADGLLQLAWVILKGSFGELKDRTIEQWADMMCAHVDRELAAHLREYRREISRPFLLNTVADCVEGWASPGMLLLGDAAHTMSPVGAQGLNLALRDAIVAANELVPALLSDRDSETKWRKCVDAAATRVEARRAPEIDLVQRLAGIPPRVVMGRTPVHALLRRAVARLAGTRFVRARAGRGMSIFLDGVTRVELRV